MSDKKEKKTIGDEIWAEIKDKEIQMYALPSQTVADHVTRKAVPGDLVFLKPKSPAVVASLQEAIGNDYICNVLEGGTITVERAKKAAQDDDDYVLFPRPNGKVEKILRKKIFG
jgi:hypothetical protein